MKLKWTYETCKEEALRYSSRSEYKKKSSGSYRSALKNGWNCEICSHMIYLGHKYKRCIYAFEFSNNHVYIGLTYNANKRKTQHLTNKNSQVYKYMILEKLVPIFYQLTEYINVIDAQIKEEEFIQKYKKENWCILNKIKSGGIGTSTIFYDKEKCQELALRYTTSSEFSKNNSSAYTSAKRNNWLDEIYSHMKNINHSPGYWTKENCKNEALKYKNRTEYFKNNASSYNKASKEKWLNDICSHMKELQKPKNYWSYEKCQEEILKYKKLSDLMKNNSSLYKKILDNKWNELINNLKTNNKWSKEKCQNEALKYHSKKDFKLNNVKCYKASIKYKWLSEICKHMV